MDYTTYTYNQLQTAVKEAGIVVTDRKKDTLIAALTAHNAAQAIALQAQTVTESTPTQAEKTAGQDIMIVSIPTATIDRITGIALDARYLAAKTAVIAFTLMGKGIDQWDRFVGWYNAELSELDPQGRVMVLWAIAVAYCQAEISESLAESLPTAIACAVVTTRKVVATVRNFPARAFILYSLWIALAVTQCAISTFKANGQIWAKSQGAIAACPV